MKENRERIKLMIQKNLNFKLENGASLWLNEIKFV